MNISLKQHSLKPVDLVVALALAISDERSVKAVAAATGVSVGETHNSFGRLLLSGLIVRPTRVVAKELFLSFLQYGMSVAFPPIWLPSAPGVPTCFISPRGAPDSDARTAPTVWPMAGGRARGRGLVPLYRSAVTLPARNPALYHLVVLLDVLRTGSVRHRTAAMQELRQRLLVDGRIADAGWNIAANDETKVPAAREAVTDLALALRPVLNRVVFSGRAAAELLASQPVPRERLPEDATITLLTTFALERLAAELRALGLDRSSRGDRTDVWRLPSGMSFEVTHIEVGDETASPWEEYSLLLTQEVAIDTTCKVRLSGGPATAAQLLDRFDDEGGAASESLSAEDFIALVAGRPELAGEVKGAPPELRAFIASHATALLRSGALATIVERIHPDASTVPAITDAIDQRLRELSGLA